LIGGGGSQISNFCLSVAAATKLSGFGDGGSKISFFLSLGGGGYETLRLRRPRLKNFQFVFVVGGGGRKIQFFSGSRQRRLKFFDDFSKICVVSRNFGIIKRKIIIENVLIRN
jgi:hypothetical protein